MLKRISWGAIFAGAVVAVVVGLLLNLLGLGIGLSTFEVGPDDTAKGFSIVQAIWFVISSLASLFAGGWVAGHLAGLPRRVDGALHGLVAWGLTTLLTVYLVSSGVGAILGGVTSLVGSGLSAAGSGIAAVAPGAADAAQRELDQRGITLDRVRAEAEALLRDTGDPDLTAEALANQADAATSEAQASAEQAAQNPASTDFRTAFDNVFDFDVAGEAIMHVLAMHKADAVRRDAAIAGHARVRVGVANVGHMAEDVEVIEDAVAHAFAYLKVDAMHHHQLSHQLCAEHRRASAQRPKERGNADKRRQRTQVQTTAVKR